LARRESGLRAVRFPRTFYLGERGEMDKTDSKAVRAAEGARDIGAVVRKKL